MEAIDIGLNALFVDAGHGNYTYHPIVAISPAVSAINSTINANNTVLCLEHLTEQGNYDLCYLILIAVIISLKSQRECIGILITDSLKNWKMQKKR